MDDIIESALVPVEFNASNAVGSEYLHRKMYMNDL